MDTQGQTIDCLLRDKRDAAAPRLFLKNAIGLHGIAETVCIDGRTANKATVPDIETEIGQSVELRQIQYVNNHIAPDREPSKGSAIQCWASSHWHVHDHVLASF